MTPDEVLEWARHGSVTWRMPEGGTFPDDAVPHEDRATAERIAKAMTAMETLRRERPCLVSQANAGVPAAKAALWFLDHYLGDTLKEVP